MNARRTALALLLLFVGGALWFAPSLGSSQRAADESAYFAGFELSMRGASPYDAPRYVYMPVFARVGAFALSHVGFRATALGLRLVNLAAACLLAWGSFAAVPSLGRARLPLAALALVLFRPLTTSLTLGNLSPIAAAATFVGLATAARVPALAGVVLAVGLAIKPTGLPALLVLGVHRPRDGSRRHLAALAVALILFVPLLTVDAHLLKDVLGRAPEWREASTNLSPHRVLAALGLDLPASVFAALLIVACALWVRTRPLSAPGLTAVACLASLVWLPRVWLHSFVFMLPAIALAIGGADSALRSARSSGSDAEPSRRAALTAAWTFLFITCIEVADACADLATVVPFLPWNPAMNPIFPLTAAVLLTRMAVESESSV